VSARAETVKLLSVSQVESQNQLWCNGFRSNWTSASWLSG